MSARISRVESDSKNGKGEVLSSVHSEFYVQLLVHSIGVMYAFTVHRECSRLKMQVEDLQEQAREVQLLRVTKDLQLSLSEEGHRGRDQHEIETLEKTLELNERVSPSRYDSRPVGNGESADTQEEGA